MSLQYIQGICPLLHLTIILGLLLLLYVTQVYGTTELDLTKYLESFIALQKVCRTFWSWSRYPLYTEFRL